MGVNWIWKMGKQKKELQSLCLSGKDELKMQVRHFEIETFWNWDILKLRHFKNEIFQILWDISIMRHFINETLQE